MGQIFSYFTLLIGKQIKCIEFLYYFLFSINKALISQNTLMNNKKLMSIKRIFITCVCLKLNSIQGVFIHKNTKHKLWILIYKKINWTFIFKKERNITKTCLKYINHSSSLDQKWFKIENYFRLTCNLCHFLWIFFWM